MLSPKKKKKEKGGERETPGKKEINLHFENLKLQQKKRGSLEI